MSVPWYLMAKGKGGVGYKTASGPIVSVNDALAAPLRSLSIGIDPVQDLHGYDSPWPAGGGKNKFDGTFLQGYWAYADGRWTNSNMWITTEKIPCKPSTYYTVSAVNKLTRWQGFMWYDENGDYISTTNQQANQNIGYTAESPATAAYMAYNIAGYPNTSSTISPSDVSQFQIEEGRNATTYAPYSNICPISGWSAANLWRTRKNLLAPAFSAGTTKTVNDVNYLFNSDGTVSVSGTCSGANAWQDVASYFSLPAGTYTLSGGAANGIYLSIRDNSNTALATSRPEPETFTISEAKTVRVRACVLANTVVPSNTVLHPMLELCSTATAYEPYTGNEFTIQLGDTVYGGTLDVINGVLTVDREYITLGGDDWAEPGDADILTTVDAVLNNRYREAESGSTARIIHGISNYYATDSTGRLDNAEIRSNGVSSNKLQLVNYKDYFNVSSFAEFQAILDATPLQLVYELATPITIPLTATEISTLQGQNVVWADCGDVTLEYLAAGGTDPDLMKLAVAFMGRK